MWETGGGARKRRYPMSAYYVQGKGFSGFSAAVAAAKVARAIVWSSDGLVRWKPCPKISKARWARYENHKAAYAAQQKMNGAT
jgi:hypothetical protein